MPAGKTGRFSLGLQPLAATPLASTLSNPVRGNLLLLRSPQPRAAPPERNPIPPRPPRRRLFPQASPSQRSHPRTPSTLNRHAPRIFLSSRRLPPGLGFPSLTTTPSQSGTHPKASRLELTGGKGGVASAAGEHSPGGGVMVSSPSSRFFLDLSHCAKPSLPGTKMVGRKLLRKRISPRDVIRARGRTKQPGCVSLCCLGNGKVSFLWVRVVVPIHQGTRSGFPKGHIK